MKLLWKRAAAIVAAASVVVTLVGCGQPQPTDTTASTLKINVSNVMVPGNWNPHTTNYINTYFMPAQAVYETIFEFDPTTAEFVPVLAEEFELSDDRKSMHVVLRDDVSFSDGTPLDSAAVNASFEALLTGSSLGATIMEPYGLELTVTGPRELEIESTTRVLDYFILQWIGYTPIVSPVALEEDPTGLETMPVGTGPYLLEEQIPEVSATFVRNPEYRDPASFPFDEVEFHVFEDAIAATNALKSGQINVASRIDLLLAEDLESSGFTVHSNAGSNFILVWRDARGEVVPALTDVRVRQAIAFALDRETINQTINRGFGEVLSQAWSIPPWHVEGADDTYDYDLTRARQLMEDAGYADGFDLVMPATPLQTAAFEPVLIQALADIGIRLTFDQFADSIDFENASARTGDYALVLRMQGDGYLVDELRWLADLGYPELATLLAARDTGTVEESADAEARIGQLVLDDALIIALSRPYELWATDSTITMQPGIVTLAPPRLRTFGPAN